MGNNFYIRGYIGDKDPSFHIGKAEVVDDKEIFYWAMNSANFLKTEKLEAPPCPGCNRAHEDKAKAIEDDNGHTYTMEEFKKDVLGHCADQNQEKVGQQFL